MTELPATRRRLRLDLPGLLLGAGLLAAASVTGPVITRLARTCDELRLESVHAAEGNRERIRVERVVEPVRSPWPKMVTLNNPESERLSYVDWPRSWGTDGTLIYLEFAVIVGDFGEVTRCDLARCKDVVHSFHLDDCHWSEPCRTGGIPQSATFSSLQTCHCNERRREQRIARMTPVTPKPERWQLPATARRLSALERPHVGQMVPR